MSGTQRKEFSAPHPCPLSCPPASRPRPPLPSPASSSISSSSSMSRPSWGDRWQQSVPSALRRAPQSLRPPLPHLIGGLITGVLQGQVHHGVLQCASHVELQGQVVDPLSGPGRVTGKWGQGCPQTLSGALLGLNCSRPPIPFSGSSMSLLCPQCPPPRPKRNHLRLQSPAAKALLPTFS